MIGLGLLMVAAMLALFGLLDLWTHAPTGTPNPSDDIWARHEFRGVPLGAWMLGAASVFLTAGVVTCVRK